MITVPEIVEELVKTSPFLEEALSENLINLSSLARNFQPQIEERLYKDVSTSSIMMALKRLSATLKKTQKSTSKFKINDITVRSNLSELTFTNSPLLIDKITNLFDELNKDQSSFITFSHGVYETTIFASQGFENRIKDQLKTEHLKAEFKNLSSITLILPKEIIYEPGIYYNILKLLAWNGIDFVEVVSSYTELTIFLNSEKIERAFTALKKLT